MATTGILNQNVSGSIPAELRHAFSKRREEIEIVAAKLGITSQDGLQEITARGRKAKVEADRESLRAQWQTEAGDYLEVVKKAIQSADGLARPGHQRSPGEVISRTQDEVFERHSAIDERVLLREALIFGRGDVGLEYLRPELEGRIATGELVRRHEQIVSRVMLRMEREYLDWALTHHRGLDDLGRASNLDPTLTQEQKFARPISNKPTSAILVLKKATSPTRPIAAQLWKPWPLRRTAPWQRS